MKLSDDYKNELSRLTLSDDFKAKLKEQCIAEAGLDKASETTEEKAPEIQETKSGKIYKQMKVYRYVAIAACIVAAVSIVGGASIMSSVFSTVTRSTDSASNEDIMEEAMDELYDTDTDWEEDSEDLDVYDEPVEDTATDDDDLSVEDVDLDTPEDTDTEYEVDAAESDTLTASPTSGSSYTPDDYDGDYNTEDYVLGGSNTSASNTADVYGSFSALAADAGYVTYSTSGGDDEELVEDADEPVEDTMVEDDDEMIDEAVESSWYDEPVEDTAVDNDESYESSSGSSLPDITTDYGTASNFYDVLYNQMGDESETIGVSLVWITITGTPDASGVPAPSSGGYTLYSANISYDYLNAVSCDIDIYVWIKGTEDYQVKGMPTYEAGDDLIVSLILGENGCITVVDELIYDAYTLNGVDIAYHRVYENVNPGNTDMGILDSEREYYTTTSNNPAIYVHKASARELTRYIRRKVNGENYNLADLEKVSQYSMGLASYSVFATTSTTDHAEEEETVSQAKSTLSINAGSSTSYFSLTAAGESISMNDSSSAERLGELYQSSMTGTSSGNGTSTAMFVGGHLTFSSDTPFSGGVTEIEITSSGCPLDIQFRGISVGDSLATVKDKLSTSSTDVASQSLTDDCVITIKSDFGTVKLTIEYGVLTKIVVSG
ncbi:MAG: hypothetical protein LUH23_04180 [Oscillospiraceae bacterium]|nr:hypothetical protein [Oscillospiraceae bacterium]